MAGIERQYSQYSINRGIILIPIKVYLKLIGGYMIGMAAAILVLSATSWADKNTESDMYFHK